MARAVLDASAVMALLLDEPGADLVAGYAGDALISTINLQEVIKTLLARDNPEKAVRLMLDEIDIEPRAFRIEDAWATARLYAFTKTKGCGVGDRSCMALAIAEGLPAVTADRVWAELAIPGLEVIVAR
jgi:PIN domain nuclease of toxin-antitoxin system